MKKRTESVRVQMSVETKKELKLLAEKYDCFYNEEASLSMLFAKVGRKELTIQPQELTIKPVSFNNYIDSNLDLLVLTMHCPFDVNGIAAKVTEKITINQGNIFRINAKQIRNNLGILKIHLSLGKYDEFKEDLINLLVDINKITLSDIKKYNNSDKLQDTYKFLINKRDNIKDIKIDEQKIILDVSCIFGIEIVSKNKSGTLNFITDKIASNQVLISSIVQNFDDTKEEDIVKVFLEIKITDKQLSEEQQRKEITNEIGKIQTIIQKLKFDTDGINIIEVNPLSIKALDALKNSGFESQDI